MASKVWTWFIVISSISSLLDGCHGTSADDRQVYIVYMGDCPLNILASSLDSVHTNIMQEVVGSVSGVAEYLLRSFRKSFNGFVAMLTEQEVQKLNSMSNVVSVFRNKKRQLHTTRSWDFLGFPEQVRRGKAVESDIIVGIFDTGIWPESESFNDEGFGPPPKKWKGTCQKFSNFSCNNKIIGAKFYRADGKFGQGDIKSPRDSEGHGTHTSSTVAGGLVRKASLLGLGSGTARGGVPSARIAVYKICWSDGCSDVDILSAFDEAIADGVDIISISVGGLNSTDDYFNDSIAIGSFHAMKKGILTSSSAGNSGPSSATLANFSPWSLSVAASTIDRKFVATVKLGNGETYEGIAINTFDPTGQMQPIIYGGDVPNTENGYNSSVSRFCFAETLDETLVKGKIVLCDLLTNGTGALIAGAVGTIMQDDKPKDVASIFPLPAAHLGTENGSRVFQYYNSTREPAAIIYKSSEGKEEWAPFVVSFSSRGPNLVTTDILKPDLTAPGVDILAAWTQDESVTGIEGDTRIVPYSIISGTSMACPHATAVAAYVKSFHPSWSPSALMSALKTTASEMTPAVNSDAEFSYGSGHINPVKAIDPGLLYDAGVDDYITFLCGEGYSSNHLRLITGDRSSCSDATNGSVWNLNYPSFTLSSIGNSSVTREFQRTVTNVGSASSTYKATAKAEPGMEIQVTPSVLSFNSLEEKKSFVVRVTANLIHNMISGSLVWDDGKHQVRTPIVAYVPLPPPPPKCSG